MTGKYFEHGQEKSDRFTTSATTNEALLELCESY